MTLLRLPQLVPYHTTRPLPFIHTKHQGLTLFASFCNSKNGVNLLKKNGFQRNSRKQEAAPKWGNSEEKWE